MSEIETKDSDPSITIFKIEAQPASLKIGWTSESGKNESGIDCFLLQWRLAGSASWNSLPETVSVPRVRLENLNENTFYDFRIKRRSAKSAVWSKFSSSFTFQTAEASTTKNEIESKNCIDESKNDGERTPARKSGPSPDTPSSLSIEPAVDVCSLREHARTLEANRAALMHASTELQALVAAASVKLHPVPASSPAGNTRSPVLKGLHASTLASIQVRSRHRWCRCRHRPQKGPA